MPSVASEGTRSELRVRVRDRARVRARFRVRVRVISPSPNPINPNHYQHDDNVSRAEKSERVTPTVSVEEAAMEAVGDRPAAALFNVLLGSV